MSSSIDADDLRTWVSLATFESTDLATFRANLTQCLKSSILKGGSDDFLTSTISWKDLVKAHDKKARTQSSLLQLVCEQLCNPTIIPAAYSARLVVCFLDALLVKPEKKSKWRSSEQLLLDHMTRVVQRIPAFSLMPALEEWQEVHTKSAREIRSKRVDAAKFHKYVSVLEEVSTRVVGGDFWFSSACTTLLFQLVRKLDSVDIELLHTTKEHSESASQDMCLACQQEIIPLTTTTTTAKRQRRVSLAQLLDENETPDHQVVVAQQFIDACRCTFLTRQPLSQAITRLPFHFVTLRSRAYETALNILCKEKSCLSKQRTKVPIAAIVVERLLDMIGSNDNNNLYYSPSLRLCLVLVANADDDEYERVVQRVWERYDQSGGYVWLRVWSELLVESSHYDAATTCWTGMEVLLSRILSYCRYDDDDGYDNSNNAKETTPGEVYHLLRTLSYVLSRRRPTLLKDATKVMKIQYRDAISRISYSFGESKYWISDDMLEEEVGTIVQTLQSVGILGLEVSSSGNLVGCSEWPFRDTLREAHLRMGPHVVAQHRASLIVSEPVDVNELQRQVNSTRRDQRQKRDDESPNCNGPVLLEHVNDDTLRTILSYLNHVDLVRIGGVNTACSIASKEDGLWKRAFVSRYGIRGDSCDTEKILSELGSWRKLFVEKCDKEKALKFKYSSKGFKHQFCQHVGCYVVLKSSELQEKHYKVHEKRGIQKRERQEAARERMKEKEAIKKTKAAEAKLKLTTKRASSKKQALFDGKAKRQRDVDTRKRKVKLDQEDGKKQVRKRARINESQADEPNKNCPFVLSDTLTTWKANQVSVDFPVDSKAIKGKIAQKAGKSVFRALALALTPPETDTAVRYEGSAEHDEAVNHMDTREGLAMYHKDDPPFLIRLREMLDKAQEDGYSDVVSWQPSGESFLIHNQHKFEADVMPICFKTMKRIKSFRSELQTHGFDYIRRRGPERGAYFHENFRRDNIVVAHKIPVNEERPCRPVQVAPGSGPNSCETQKNCPTALGRSTEEHPLREHSPGPAGTTDDRDDRNPENEDPFPIVLHKMLAKAEQDGHSDIVSWQPHGRCFRIHKPRDFRTISEIENFREQLEAYGFNLMRRKGPDRHAYYHNLFLRGKTSLAYQIPRLTGNNMVEPNSGVARKRIQEPEPDFYNVSPIMPDHEPLPMEQDSNLYLQPGHLSPLRDTKSSGLVSSPRPPKGTVSNQRDDDYTAFGTVSTMSSAGGIKVKKGHRKHAFPANLYRMLERVEEDGYSDIVSWQPHGRCFRIHDRKAFEATVMPLYLPTLKKFNSFQCTLLKFRFVMMRRDGPDKGAFYQDLFLRGQPSLIPQILSVKTGRETGKRPVPDQEPDFYNMPEVVPDEELEPFEPESLGNETQSHHQEHSISGCELDFGRSFHSVAEDCWSLPGINGNEEDLGDVPRDIVDL